MLRRLAQTAALLAPLTLIACAPSADLAESTADTDSALTGGDPLAIEIGFNGPTDQFAYVPKFMTAGAVSGQKRVLCHTYIDWKVADEAEGGDPTVDGTRAYLEDYLKKAQGTCDEVMLSFKAQSTTYVPTVKDYTTHMQRFFDARFAEKAGFKGDLVLTPWNEPNNPAGAGNGTGDKIHADTAARYFLSLAQLCTTNHCTAVAGDFASNGNMWNDMEYNCADADGPEADLCNKPSSENRDGQRGPSYLDIYKNTIANEATDYGLPEGFRPHAFAFHGWHDINEYIAEGSHCSSYSDCVTRRVVASMSGSWGHIPIWDTETGVGQNGALGDGEQACAAAFLVRVTALSSRITRMYLTRLHRGTETLFDDANTARPAMGILARRDETAKGYSCK